MIELKDYQIEGVEFLKKNKKCILSDETGLGKTVQGLQVLKDCGEQVLLIAPKKLCKQWEEAGESFGVKVCLLYKREPVADDDAILINYASFKRYSEQIKALKLKHVMVDEAHMLANRNSARTKLIKKVTNKYESKWLLTATPVWDKLDSAWSLLNMLDKKKFSSYWRFVNTYCIVIRSQFGSEIKGVAPARLEEVQALLKDYVLVRRKSDVLDIPKMEHILVELKPDFRLRKENKNIRDTIKEETGFQNKSRAMAHLMDRDAFRFEEGERLFDDSIPSLKKKETLSIIEKERGNKILILTKYQESARLALAWLKEANVWHNAHPIVGEVSQKERAAFIKEFQAVEGSACLLGTCKTLGVGIDGLQVANVIILLEHPDNYTELKQILGRVARIGTTKEQRAYHIIQKLTWDARNFRRCMDKAKEFKSIMEGL